MKKYVAAFLFLTTMLAGCRHMYIERSVEEKVEMHIDSAVSQIVRTLRPMYRNYKEYRKRYGGKERDWRSRAYGLTDDEYKLRLGFVGIVDLSGISDNYRSDSSDLHLILTEKILASTFMRKEISDNFMILERLSYKDLVNWEPDEKENESVEDSGHPAPVVNVIIRKGDEDKDLNVKFEEAEKYKYSNKETPKDRNKRYKYDRHRNEEKRWREIQDPVEDKGGTHFPKWRKHDKSSSFNSGDGVHAFNKYESLTLATYVAQKYREVEVLQTGFIVESEDHYELHLRMVETRTGQVIAVGSTRIKRELLDTYMTSWSGWQ